eukprot:gnl/MRDRNA2_/MRDRNA2_108034_c0_seq1.p1 gnl/MRDRNA2_/MRDRNA2_108034_c0~~gnl/MRDRNA2_/MRDRNA2_108034_c0_seq1.p1  ORF type:complete len:280 (-),score=66.70 gnl/MRDRNA2_/MRDRNA2_108034_c0_seq1:329-1168(-)
MKGRITLDTNPFVGKDPLEWIYSPVPKGHPRPPTILRIAPPVEEEGKAKPVQANFKPGPGPPMEPIPEELPGQPPPLPPTRVPQTGLTNGACDSTAIGRQREALQELKVDMLSVKPPADQLKKMPYSSRYSFEKALKLMDEHDSRLIKFGIDVVDGTTKCNNDKYIKEVHKAVDKLCKMTKGSMRDARRLSDQKKGDIKFKCENLQAVTEVDAPFSGFERASKQKKKKKKGPLGLFSKKAAMDEGQMLFAVMHELMLMRSNLPLVHQKRHGFELGQAFL